MHEWNGHQEIFSRPQEIKKKGNICFSEQIQILQKTVVGCP